MQKPAVAPVPEPAAEPAPAKGGKLAAAAAAAAAPGAGAAAVASHHLHKRPELKRVESVGLVSNDSLNEEEVEQFFAPEGALEEEERLRREREEAEAAAATKAADPPEAEVRCCCVLWGSTEIARVALVGGRLRWRMARCVADPVEAEVRCLAAWLLALLVGWLAGCAGGWRRDAQHSRCGARPPAALTGPRMPPRAPPGLALRAALCRAKIGLPAAPQPPPPPRDAAARACRGRSARPPPPQQAALDQAKFSQLEALLNRSQMYTQFLTEQVGGPSVCGAARPCVGLGGTGPRCAPTQGLLPSRWVG